MANVPVVLKTEAIALTTHDVSNTSRVVVWLSPDYGRIATILRGAHRPKSPFLGQFDLYYTCELLFYRRNGAGLPPARECAPLETREPLRRHWRAALCASHLCDLADKAAPPAGAGAAALYGTLRRALDRLAEHPEPTAVVGALLWFESRFLALSGWFPNLRGCGRCLDRGVVVRVSFAEGRVVCDRCGGEAAIAVVALPRNALARLSAASRPDSSPGIFDGLPYADLLPLRRFLGMFIRYHLDLDLEARALLLEHVGPRA